jgi:DNA topoisomerase-1
MSTTTHGADPAEIKAAGLRHVHDGQPGIRRERDGEGGFRYVAPDGRVVDDERTLARIRALGIPPAYEDVWICPSPNGYLQATGHDAKGRKQYRYHPRWREVRDETKYERMMAFGDALPRIRARVDRDLAQPGLPREKVLATVVRLLETTLIRVGNEQYAKENGHYGLTTMHTEHVDVEGQTLHFHFVGKSGKEHTVDVKDRRLARVVQRLRDLPGQEVFQYVDDDGHRRSVDSSDVNAYLHEVAGEEFTAKDFRTWAGTVLASLALQEFEAFGTPTQAKRNVSAAIKAVAQRLGNTPAICRRCYVHPAVLESYLDGTMARALEQRAEQELADTLHTLRPEEAAVMALLSRRLAQEAAAKPAPSGT